MFRTIERYEESALGLPYPVVLINAAQEEVDEKGTPIGIHIPDMEGLVACVAIARALHPQALDGRDVRFIRRALGMAAKDFASSLEMDAATLSRWENNKYLVGAWADKQVRMAAVIKLRDRVPSLSLDTKAVVDLHAFPAPQGQWPELELHRIQRVTASCCPESQDWDALPVSLAA